MEHWKRAFELALFELKESTTGFIVMLFFYTFIALYMIISFPSYLEKNFLGIDGLFLIAFSVAPIWARPKQFQLQKQQYGYMLPTVVMLQQLPIPKDVIIKSRMIIYYVYTLPVQSLLLVSLYLFSKPLQDMMTLGTYIVFMIIWLSFSIYAGSIFLTTDMGDQTPPIKAMIYTIVIIIIVFSLMLANMIIFEYGIVYWTLVFAKEAPILSACISIILAFLGYHYWYRYMKKRLNTLDYMS